MSSIAPPQVYVRFPIEDSLYQQYQAQAVRSGKTIESFLADRMRRSIGWTGEKPLHLGDEERQALEKTLGRNISDVGELLRVVQRLASIQVGDVSVTLPLRLIERLRSRAGSMPFAEYVTLALVQMLERQVGM